MPSGLGRGLRSTLSGSLSTEIVGVGANSTGRPTPLSQTHVIRASVQSNHHGISRLLDCLESDNCVVGKLCISTLFGARVT